MTSTSNDTPYQVREGIATQARQQAQTLRKNGRFEEANFLCDLADEINRLELKVGVTL